MTRLALAPLLFLCAAAVAADDAKPVSPPEKLAAIKKQHEEAEAAFRKEMEALPETPEGREKGRGTLQGVRQGTRPSGSWPLTRLRRPTRSRSQGSRRSNGC